MWHDFGSRCMHVSQGVSRMAPAIERGQSLCLLLLAPRSGFGLLTLATSPRDPTACWTCSCHPGWHVLWVSCSSLLACSRKWQDPSPFGGIKWWEEMTPQRRTGHTTVEAKVYSMKTPDKMPPTLHPKKQHYIQGSWSSAELFLTWEMAVALSS